MDEQIEKMYPPLCYLSFQFVYIASAQRLRIAILVIGKPLW